MYVHVSLSSLMDISVLNWVGPVVLSRCYFKVYGYTSSRINYATFILFFSLLNGLVFFSQEFASLQIRKSQKMSVFEKQLCTILGSVVNP